MKKLKLTALSLGAKEVLSRAQLKNVLGGSGSGSGSAPEKTCTGTCSKTWSTPNGTHSTPGTCTKVGTGSTAYCECSIPPGSGVVSNNCVLS